MELHSTFSTLLSATVGALISYHSTKHVFLFRRKKEIKEEVYAKITGLKTRLVQAFQTNREAQILTEFYDYRYRHITNSSHDHSMAKEENRRMLDTIPYYSGLQGELFASLAHVRIAYKITPEIDSLVQELYSFKSFNAPEAPGTIITEDQLEEWKDAESTRLHDHIQDGLTTKISLLLPLLRSQI